MDRTPQSAESTSATNKTDAIFFKMATPRNTTILFWSAFALYLLYSSYVPPGMIESRWLILLLATLFLATIGLWIVADGRSREIGGKWLRVYFAGAVIFPLVALVLPVYLVHSRGWAGAAKSTLRFTGYLLLAAVIWYGVVGTLEIFDIHEVGEHKVIFDKLHS